MAAAAALAMAVPWAYFATINPTVGGALVAAAGSIVTVLANNVLIRRHERHVDERFDQRRNVVVLGTPEDPGTLIVTAEERRQLEADRRQESESRKLRERRRRERRDGRT